MGDVTHRIQLAIDASAGPASVALFIDAQVRQHRRIDRQGSAELLAPTIADMLTAEGLCAADLHDVIVGGGPGSFTGVRVAAALAKGLAHGAGAALHAVPSLPLIAASMRGGAAGTYLCVLDALRGEWFVQQASVDAIGTWTVDDAMRLMTIDAVHARARDTDSRLVGPPVDAHQQPDAIGALLVGPVRVPLAAWEPEYGRLAEAQVKWEAVHARALPTS